MFAEGPTGVPRAPTAGRGAARRPRWGASDGAGDAGAEGDADDAAAERAHHACDRQRVAAPDARDEAADDGADTSEELDHVYSSAGPPPALRAWRTVRDDVRWKRLRDRKSTRLNSSHLGISYAV